MIHESAVCRSFFLLTHMIYHHMTMRDRKIQNLITIQSKRVIQMIPNYLKRTVNISKII